MSTSLRHFLADAQARFRSRGRAGVARVIRLTGAAVVSYLVAHWMYPQTLPLLAPLTTLLVVQLTLTSMVRHGFDRVASVVLGVGLAIVFSSVVGLTWWSLGALIACSLLVGQIARLGPNLVEVPISAMLVLGVSAGTQHYAATDRIAETLVGAIVGVLVNFLLPPGVRTRDAGKAVARFADDIADLVNKAAGELRNGVTSEQAVSWLIDARKVTAHTPGIGRALEHAEESRRMNVRALGTLDTAASLRFGLDSLEHSSVAIRSMFRAISDGVIASPENSEPYGDDLRSSMSALLKHMALAVRTYGSLVDALAKEADELHHGNASQTVALFAALDMLRIERESAAKILAKSYLEDSRLREVNVYLIATADRVLRELDLGELRRLQPVWTDRHRQSPVVMIRTTTRQLAERPLRRS